MALKTINNPGILRQEHRINVPPLCPKTGNPIEGSIITITYQPTDKVLEVYNLTDYIASFIGSNEVRDLEVLTVAVARGAAAALEVEVKVIGEFVLNIGQTVICECRS